MAPPTPPPLHRPPPSPIPTLYKLALSSISRHLPEHHPSNFVTLEPSTLGELLRLAVARHYRNKVEASRTKTLIRANITKSYLMKFEKYVKACPSESLNNAWKCVVDEDFPVNTFDRPAIFSRTFTELASAVTVEASKLQKLISSTDSDKAVLKISVMSTLASLKKLPISSKLLSETKIGKVMQRIVSRKDSSATNVSERGHELAASLLESWKAAASMELGAAPPPLPKTAEESQMKDSVLLCECLTYRDLYRVLEDRKLSIKNQTSKIRAHRESISGKRKSTKEVTTVMSRKAAKRAGMLMGRVERGKQEAKRLRNTTGTAAGQKISKLWRETKKVSNLSRAPPPMKAKTTHVGLNPHSGRVTSKSIIAPKKKNEVRELQFPKHKGIFHEIKVNKRRDTARKSVTDTTL